MTASLVGDLVNDRRWSDAVHRARRRGDEIVTQVQAGGLSLRSDLLPSGLRARLIVLAEALRRAATADPTSPAWAAVDTAWETVERHALAATDPAPLRPLQAAVRLARWLSTVEEVRAGGPVDVTALARHHLEHGAWVDAAINDAFEGVDDEAVSAGLRAVLDAARSRRHREERAFAACFARDAADEAPVPSGSGADPKDASVLLLENLLPHVVIPMARKAPLLLLVMDGMSAATATEVVADATSRHGWLEAAVPGTASPTGPRRSACSPP